MKMILTRYGIPTSTFVLGLIVAAVISDYATFKSGMADLISDLVTLLAAYWHLGLTSLLLVGLASGLVLTETKRRRQVAAIRDAPPSLVAHPSLTITSIDEAGAKARCSFRNANPYKPLRIYVQKCDFIFSSSMAREGRVRGHDKVLVPPGGSHSFYFDGPVVLPAASDGAEWVSVLAKAHCQIVGRYDDDGGDRLLADLYAEEHFYAVHRQGQDA